VTGLGVTHGPFWAVALSGSALLGCGGETRVELLAPIGSDATTSTPRSASHLIHRYSFNGDGTRVVDSVGAAHGSLENGAVLDGAGHATLDGVDDYVDLPNGLLSGLTDATLVAWLAWNGGPCWQRVFDFGSSDAGEGMVGKATSSLFVTPKGCPGPGPSTAFETTSVLGSVDSDVPFPTQQTAVIAVVADTTGQELRLYAAGAPLGVGKASPLALLSDDNDWLGRSQWVQDLYLSGTYDEFRIYDQALSALDLAALEAAGPDALVP
jgi:hypothetical protein